MTKTTEAPVTTDQLRPATDEALKRAISRERCVRLIQSGKIPGVRIGKSWYAIIGGEERSSGR